jgi:hypothetical protein
MISLEMTRLEWVILSNALRKAALAIKAAQREGNVAHRSIHLEQAVSAVDSCANWLHERMDLNPARTTREDGALIGSAQLPLASNG